MPAAEPHPGGTPILPLRDLHLPEPPGFWPPAPGWWLVFGGLLLVLVLAWVLGKRRKRLRYRRAALRQLAKLERQKLADRDLLVRVSSLLRRAALAAFPQSGCAGLQGENWLLFLDAHDQGADAFSHGPGRCLAAGPYQPAPQYDRAALLGVCRSWLKQLPPQPRAGRGR